MLLKQNLLDLKVLELELIKLNIFQKQFYVELEKNLKCFNHHDISTTRAIRPNSNSSLYPM